jgi:hypothetical protein
VGNVSEKNCEEFRRSLGREIGETKEKAAEAQACAMKKVEKTNFRWTLGILIAVMISALGICYYLAFSATNGVQENRGEIKEVRAEDKAAKEQVKGVKEDLRDFRTEQRKWNQKQEERQAERMQELRDLLKPR